MDEIIIKTNGGTHIKKPNIVSYSITTVAINCTISGGSSSMSVDDTVVFTIYPAVDQSDITVTNATYNYSKIVDEDPVQFGKLTISNPTDNITITIDNTWTYSQYNKYRINNEVLEIKPLPTLPDQSEITDEQFANNSNFNSIIIYEGICGIGESAFEFCGNVSSVIIPSSVQDIPTYAFRACPLSELNLPNSIHSIGDGAFMGCHITTLIFSNNLTTIGSSAFSDCYSLTSVVFGTGLTSISDYAFFECSMLDTIYYRGTEEQWNQIDISSSSGLEGKTIIYNYTD